MLDFLMITRKQVKGVHEISPVFIVDKSKDLMTRSGDFYAVWDEEEGIWSKDEFKAISMIDGCLDKYFEEHRSEFDGEPYRIKYLWNSDTGSIDRWHKFVKNGMPESFHPLDETLTFLNDKKERSKYASMVLPYPLKEGDISAYEELMNVLYSEEDRKKLEWAIGSVVAGDSKDIQKFIVLYGGPGTGKSTVLSIIQKMFEGYYCVFDAKALGSKSEAFALEPFLNNPLVGIQHDGDLSRIEDNTRLNSLVSHEFQPVNAKNKAICPMKLHAFLFIGTNKPVKITDAKSGILRRLIDVSPTGEKIPIERYNELMSQIEFEYGAIATHCLNVYKSNKYAYDRYVPSGMMEASNDFYNFVADSFDIFTSQETMTLKQAWTMYKNYADEAKLLYPFSMRSVKEELKNYYDEYADRKMEDGVRHRNIYTGFKKNLFGYERDEEEIEEAESLPAPSWIDLKEQKSLLDDILADMPAQYGSETDIPLQYKWKDVTTTLKDISTNKLHYVRVPTNHIVIDFDIKGEDGEKSFEENLKAASKWPKTYAELSKSGKGIHLHYIYEGDASKLIRLYDEDIEVKVFIGLSSLRRKLTKCNDIPIASISSGIPLREEKDVVNFNAIKNEKAIRTLIAKNLRKEYHGATKPSVDFIYDILERAYAQGLHYDVTDMRPSVMAFATNSTHQADYCMKKVMDMKFKSEEPSENVETTGDPDELIFFDVEVFPNLFVVVWKAPGKNCVKMINPTPQDIELLCNAKLVGFNNKGYDNHILYARLIGHNNAQLFEDSQRIINKSPNAYFREAYNLSYTDIYDFCSKKQSLKKWEIELGIHHQELGLPWDQPVPEELWDKVADYCCNDVIATEALFNAREADWLARQILADIAGGSVNESTNALSTKLVFGNEKHPKLIYTDLATGEQY